MQRSVLQRSVISAAVAAVAGCTTPGTPSSGGDNSAAGDAAGEKVAVSFTTEVKPILENKCAICHNRQTLPGRPSFESRELAMIPGSRGPVISPGNPDNSMMLKLIEESPVEDRAMPPVGHRLTAEEIETLRQWIDEGADWPAGKEGRVVPAFIPTE